MAAVLTREAEGGVSLHDSRHPKIMKVKQDMIFGVLSFLEIRRLFDFMSL